MKKNFLVFIICIFIFSTTCNAEWLHSINEGFDQAYRKDKLLMVDFYTDWCGWCKKLSSEVFQGKKFNEFVKDNFVLVKLNAEKYKKLTSKYGISGYPTVLILNKYGYELDRVVGFANEEAYIEKTKEAAYSVDNFYNLQSMILKTNPDNRHVHYKLGKKYFERNKIKNAKKHILKAVDLDPSYSDSYLLLGKIFIKNNLIDESEKYFEKALKYDPENINIFIDQAYALMRSKYFEKSIKYYNLFLKNAVSHKDNNNILKAAYYRVICAIEIKDKKMAQKYLEEFKNVPGSEKYITKMQQNIDNM